jgi:hypothetical protein
MKPFTNHLREDVEEQFELPEIPRAPKVENLRDMRRPCKHCSIEECKCIGFKLFD